MMLNDTTKIYDLLSSIYGDNIAQEYTVKVIKKIEKLKEYKSNNTNLKFSEKDSFLITYGDSILKKNENPLKTLDNFLNTYLKDYINTVHILPFFPYTSDDGFSIRDYKEVNQSLGSWNDIKQINTNFNLMFDLVANHVSSKSKWFQGYIDCEKPYDNFFITCDDSKDYSKVFRPRALDLLSEVETKEGKKKVWTTFSSDQIDLNYQNPELLMQIIDVFSYYVEKGASFIRLDAIAFIWKELGTSCIHNKQTHDIIKLFKLIIDLSNINVKIITETNVPHKENISYFGNGYNEASMVYNFPLPPLTLYTFWKKDASIIKKWVSSLELPSNEVTFFNFLASHDGIGLLPAKGIVDDKEIANMATKVQEIGGFVSYKKESNGKESPYEMNVNYFDGLKICGNIDENLEIKRFLASQSILLSLKGIPAIYIHSLIGSRNWIEGVKINKSNRSINREKINFDLLEKQISDETSTRSKIINGYKKLLEIRKNNKCFSPLATQEIINNLDQRIFSLKRSIDNDSIICLTNVSNDFIQTPYKDYKFLDNNIFDGILKPYQVAWLIDKREIK